MSRVTGGMSFIQNLLLLGLLILHNQSILEPQCAFRILTETSNLSVTFLYSSLDVAQAFIVLLRYNDLTLQGGGEGDVEQ
jgi:hypothetical protein